MTRFIKRHLVVGVCSKELQFENTPVVCGHDVEDEAAVRYKYFEISSGTQKFTTKLQTHDSVPKGCIWCNKLIRIAFSLTTDASVKIDEISESNLKQISKLNCIIKFLKEPQESRLNSDDLKHHIIKELNRHCLNVSQSYVIKFKSMLMSLEIEDILDVGMNKLSCGMISSKTQIFFELAEQITAKRVDLTGSSIIYRNKLIDSSLDFSDIGIGGLDVQVAEILRRIFTSRMVPQNLLKEMGVKHVKGFLLYGPPGTGKTLIARQIAKILKSKPPKLVNGPDILDKYIGESEKKLRDLFKDAERDFKELGPKSPLHVIIFDEIDAICRQRGTSGSSSKVGDNIVNQLLTKIDGLEQIDNVLIIGMTNRFDLIDDALLRPGRLELQLKIALPDLNGRIQILKIHTSTLKNNKRISEDVNLELLAKKTENFTGAELAGLVRAAVSNSYSEYITTGAKIEVNPDINKAIVTPDHFDMALDQDIKPAFGTMNDSLKSALSDGIILFNKKVEANLSQADMMINKAKKAKRVRLTTLLVAGDNKSGTTAFGAHLASLSKCKFTKMINPNLMADMGEFQRKQLIHTIFEDAYSTETACIFIDDFERLIGYINIGPVFSTTTLQTLMTYLKAPPPGKCNLLVIMTTSRMDLIDQIDLQSIFSEVLETPKLTSPKEIIFCLDELSPSLSKKCQESIMANNNLAGFSMGIKEFVEKVEICENLEESQQSTQMLRYLQANALPML